MKRYEIDIDKELLGYNKLVIETVKSECKRLNELGYSFSTWKSDIYRHIAVIFDKRLIQKYSFTIDESWKKGATYIPDSHYLFELIRCANNHHEALRNLA